MSNFITMLLALFIITSCGRNENSSDQVSASISSEGGCFVEDGACEQESPLGRALIALADYDMASSFSRAKYSNAALTATYVKNAHSTRNNTYSKVTVTYRKSTEAASKRSALSSLGSGTVTVAGLKTYSAKATALIQFKNVPAGTYYLYYKFETNGEDVMTYIYKLVVTN